MWYLVKAYEEFIRIKKIYKMIHFIIDLKIFETSYLFSGIIFLKKLFLNFFTLHKLLFDTTFTLRHMLDRIELAPFLKHN